MAFNQKNPPWQRNAGQSIAGMQTIVSFPQAQPVFNQGMGLQQQQNLSLIPQMGLQQQQIYSQAVQYPTSRPINTLAFQNQSQAQQSAQVSQGSSKFNPNQRVFSGTGHVTKVQNDFGFIDEEVFFHKNVCKGMFPKVGDRVLVEAAYNQNMPFKWNATRVQVLQSASSGSASNSSSSRHASNYGSSQTSNADRSGRSRYSPRKSSPDRHGHRSSNRDSRHRDGDDDDRRRRRDDRDNDRHREKRDRSSERDRRDRERSPVRKLSPKRRKVRPIPRYMVQMPKQLLTLKAVDILELRRRYHTLYIPSDFFSSEVRWVDAFPPNAPFSIRKPCAFHVMHKDVEPLHPNDVNLEPADADYLYSAKVMLMGTPPLADFYQKCFTTTEDRERHDEDPDHVHPTRLINFLVGIRGKNETMAIGGPWSPSLDGENPHSNPNVLIKTAIRTCKGLTGIDLSNCTRWYRFVELYYRRSETYHKGRLIPARIEMVVIFLPDVRSCQPTNPEWDELHLSYKSHLERIINSQNSDSPVPAESSSAVNAGAPATSTQQTSPEGDTVASSDAKASVDAPADAASATGSSTDTSAAADTKNPSKEKADSSAAKEEADAAEDNEKDDGDADAEKAAGAPTNYALLDVKKMKVVELKAELLARNLPTDGVKNTLSTRLAKALKQEQADAEGKDGEDKTASKDKEDEKASEDKEAKTESEKPTEKEEEEFETMDNVDMSEVTVIDEYDSKSEERAEETSKKAESTKLTEKERQLLEKRYSLPEQPHIIVHPSRTAKSGKFDCAVMSLSVLLDYRPEDSKEHSFEVSLFAELFNEMLTRDFGFNIYKALHMLPSKKEDEPKKEATVEEVKDDDDKKVNGDGAKDKEKSAEESTKSKDDKDDKDKERARERDRDSRKRSRFDDASEEERRRKEKEKEKERERLKYYTADRDLLLSFTYFDISHCGYIFDKDVEDLFYTLGLNLSRSQIRRLVSKAVTRDSLYYRKLTDKVKETTEETNDKEKDEEQKETAKEGTEKEAVVATPAVKTEKTEVTVELTEAELEELATGNCNVAEQLRVNLQAVLANETAEGDDAPPTKKIKLEPLKDESDIPETNNGLVLHNGGVLDIPKLLEQMRRTEKAREDTEQLLIDLRRQVSDLTKSQSRSNEKAKDQAADIKSLTRKLVDAEQNLREITKKSNEYFSTLSSVYDRVSVVMHRADPKRSSSISSSKRGSSRDRSSRKDDKSKDKEPESSKDSADKVKVEDSKKSDDGNTSTEATVTGSDSKESVDSSDKKAPEESTKESKSSEEKSDEEKKKE